MILIVILIVIVIVIVSDLTGESESRAKLGRNETKRERERPREREREGERMSGTSPIMVLLGWAMRWQCWAGRVACGTLVARGPGDEHGRSRDAGRDAKKERFACPDLAIALAPVFFRISFFGCSPGLLLIANKADNVYKAVK